MPLKKGSAGTIVVVAVVFLALVGGVIFTFNKLNLLPVSKVQTGGTFGNNPILRSYKFTNSKGEKKKLLIVKTKEDVNLPVADVFIADENQKEQNAIKIDALSADSSLGYAAQNTSLSGSSFTFDITHDSNPKHIILTLTVGDATTMTIMAENGTIASQEPIANILKDPQSNCPCKFTFDSFEGDRQFWVKFANSSGKPNRALIDIPSGLMNGAIQKIS